MNGGCDEEVGRRVSVGEGPRAGGLVSVEEHARWIRAFYEGRDWYAYPPATRMLYLTEEVGELAQAVRAKEIGRDHPHDHEYLASDSIEHVREELADVFDNLIILADIYGITLDELAEASERKLIDRFGGKR